MVLRIEEKPRAMRSISRRVSSACLRGLNLSRAMSLASGPLIERTVLRRFNVHPKPAVPANKGGEAGISRGPGQILARLQFRDHLLQLAFGVGVDVAVALEGVDCGALALDPVPEKGQTLSR